MEESGAERRRAEQGGAERSRAEQQKQFMEDTGGSSRCRAGFSRLLLNCHTCSVPWVGGSSSRSPSPAPASA